MTSVLSEQTGLRPGAEIFVRREGHAVVVGSEGDLDRAAIERLRAILADLIDGQGNLTIEVTLPATGVDLRLLDVLVEAERRLSARDGRFVATTRVGRWEAGSAGANR